MKKIIYLVTGSLLIAVSYNLFFLLYDIVPNGIFGVGALLNYKTGYDPALFLIIANALLIILALFVVSEKQAREYVWAGLLIPIFMFFTHLFTISMTFTELEKIMAVIAGSFLTGLGYSLIYKTGNSVGGIDIIQDIFNNITIYKNKFISYGVEVIILITTYFILDFESMLYSLIVIFVIRYTSTKSKIGVSSNKTFYIITTKQELVKKYIIEELKHDLTEFDTKGGFSNTKGKILMVSIDTKTYYELKEGILFIDPNAFISITDGYEVINKNISINKTHKKHKK